METKPFNMQDPRSIVDAYGGNKQKIAQAVQMGIVDPTAALLAGMNIDRIIGAQAQMPTQTVAQQTFTPPVLPPPGPSPLPSPAQGGMPPQQPPMQQALGAARGGSINYYAGGGLTDLELPPGMYDEDTFANGGLADALGFDPKYPESKVATNRGRASDFIHTPAAERKRKQAEYREYAVRQATANGVNPKNVVSMFESESEFVPDIGSPTGPLGIGQLTAGTARDYGLKVAPKGVTPTPANDERFDPYKNMDASIAYIKHLHGRYDGDDDKIALGYNMGESNFDKFLKQNQGYVDRVALETAGQGIRPNEPLLYLKNIETARRSPTVKALFTQDYTDTGESELPNAPQQRFVDPATLPINPWDLKKNVARAVKAAPGALSDFGEMFGPKTPMGENNRPLPQSILAQDVPPLGPRNSDKPKRNDTDAMVAGLTHLKDMLFPDLYTKSASIPIDTRPRFDPSMLTMDTGRPGTYAPGGIVSFSAGNLVEKRIDELNKQRIARERVLAARRMPPQSAAQLMAQLQVNPLQAQPEPVAPVAPVAPAAPTMSEEDYQKYLAMNAEEMTRRPTLTGLPPQQQPSPRQVSPPTAGLAAIAPQPTAQSTAPQSGVGDFMEQFLKLQGEPPAPTATSKEELAAQKKEDLWTALAQLGFGTAAASSEPGATFLGSVGKGGTGMLPGVQEALKARRAGAKEAAREQHAYELARYGFKGDALKSALQQYDNQTKQAFEEKKLSSEERRSGRSDDTQRAVADMYANRPSEDERMAAIYAKAQGDPASPETQLARHQWEGILAYNKSKINPSPAISPTRQVVEDLRSRINMAERGTAAQKAELPSLKRQLVNAVAKLEASMGDATGSASGSDPLGLGL